MTNFTLSKKQTQVIDSIFNWYRESKGKYITLGGFAGTGKSTILGFVSKKLHKENEGIKIAFCSYTGKASRVLERKLKDVSALFPSDYIGTIHR
nr:AAA family ATPase [Candidatus Dojkabacteria bacterium]